MLAFGYLRHLKWKMNVYIYRVNVYLENIMNVKSIKQAIFSKGREVGHPLSPGHT